MCGQTLRTPPGSLSLLIACLLLASILVVLTAGTVGAAGIVIGYGAGWAHSAVRSP